MTNIGLLSNSLKELNLKRVNNNIYIEIIWRPVNSCSLHDTNDKCEMC